MNEVNIYSITSYIWNNKFLITIIGIILYVFLFSYNNTISKNGDLKINIKTEQIQSSVFKQNVFYLKYNLILTRFFKGDTVFLYEINPNEIYKIYMNFFEKQIKKNETINTIDNLKIDKDEKIKIKRILDLIPKQKNIRVNLNRSTNDELKKILKNINQGTTFYTSNFFTDRYYNFYKDQNYNLKLYLNDPLNMFKVLRLDDKVLNLVEVDKNVFINLLSNSNVNTQNVENNNTQNIENNKFLNEIENKIQKSFESKLDNFEENFKLENIVIDLNELIDFSYTDKITSINVIKTFLILYFLIIFILIFFNSFIKSYVSFKK
tara:strand:+ start:55 stop:1017 length:963 start_codon:yes stop_codon:yes gene_type:complete